MALPFSVAVGGLSYSLQIVNSRREKTLETSAIIHPGKERTGGESLITGLDFMPWHSWVSSGAAAAQST